ncbi:MAG: hypothetical protein K2N61_07095 [Lachnospiraceae bacterium]|nr:hypothetical protein [Lachnospiraceae bacterium]
MYGYFTGSKYFTEKGKGFNREMIQRAKHDTDRDNSASNAEKNLSPSQKYFSCVNDILSDYCRK